MLQGVVLKWKQENSVGVPWVHVEKGDTGENLSLKPEINFISFVKYSIKAVMSLQVRMQNAPLPEPKCQQSKRQKRCIILYYKIGF